MTSTITKFVAAGVFVAAVLLSITFLDKTVAPAYAIEQSFETMKRATWMHVTRDFGAGNFEYWISYPKKIVAAKHSSGKVTYHDNNMLFTYEPSSEKLTISQTEIDAFGTLGQSPLRFVETVKNIFLETDGEIIEEQILHNQKNATIYKMTTIIEAKNVLVEFVVGNEDNLPVQMVQQYFDAENGSHKKVVINIDYLEFGPRSIYDIGVPKETTIVNNMPTKNVSQLLEAFQSHKNGAPSRYIAVAADYFFYQPAATNIIYQVRVIYKDGKYQRVEYYGVPQDNLAGYYENWHISKSQMGDTVESLLSWWQGSEIALLAQIDLYDGKFYYQLRRDDNLKWKTLPRVYSLKNDFRADDDIADFGWDAYLSASITDSGSSPLAVVENDYSNDNNLICLETKTQGRIITDSIGKVWAVAPSRKAYYLNPERDYICHRFEQEEKFDAPWQKDKGLIKTIEQEHINKNPAVNRVREVTEYGQTEQGLWYPKIIKSWDPNNASSYLRVKRVYLNSDPVFPDNIFNSKLLPE